MGSIISTGIGSGLDIDGIVTRLVQVEGAATAARFDQREAEIQAKLSAYGTFRGALDGLQQALAALKRLSTFQQRTATAADPDVLGAAASAVAVPGRYDVEVQQLAQAARLASVAYASGSGAVVGTGTLTIAVGGSSFAVEIDAGSSTLAGIRDAINAAPDNAGVRAAIINTIDGSRLVLTGAATGAGNAITVTQAGGDGGLAALVYDPDSLVTNLEVVSAAQDAIALVEGFAIGSDTNSIADAIDGVTLELKAVSEPGVATTVTVGEDRDAITRAIEAFVTAYNAVAKSVRDLTFYNPETRQGGPLLGDAVLRNFGSALSRELGASVSIDGVGFRNLSAIGIRVTREGTLQVDSAALSAALDAAGNEGIGQLFAAEAGFAQRLDTLVNGYIGANGLLDGRTQGLRATIEDINDAREALDRRLTSLEQRLRAQFNAMDALVGQLRTTGTNLVQQLDALTASLIVNQG